MSTHSQDKNPKAKLFVPEIQIEKDSLIVEDANIPFSNIESILKTNMASSKLSLFWFGLGIFSYFFVMTHSFDRLNSLVPSVLAIPFMINYFIKRRWYMLVLITKEKKSAFDEETPFYTLMITKDESAIDALAEKIRKATKKAGHEILFASRKV